MWKAQEFCQRRALPLPFSMEKPEAEDCSLSLEELEIKQGPLYSTSAASRLTYT